MNRLHRTLLFAALAMLGAIAMFWLLPLEVSIYTFTPWIDKPTNRKLWDYLASTTFIFLATSLFAYLQNKRRALKSSLVLDSSYSLLISLLVGIPVALAHFNFRGDTMLLLWAWLTFSLPVTGTFLIADGWLRR